MEYLNEKLDQVRERDFLQYRSSDLPTWCPGCGYFGIMDAFYKAVRELDLKYENICMVSGIGCSGRTPIFSNSYGFHTLHGRSIPVASGLKLAREDLTVFAVAGDGDALGIGGGHLPHVARKNIDLTFLLFDNSIYGLTKGQSSATTSHAMKTSSHPAGNPDTPLNPIRLALAYGASFVARAYAGNPEGTKEIIKQGTVHKGFSFIQVLTPCVTFDKTHRTWKSLKENVYDLKFPSQEKNMEAAMRAADYEPHATGIFFHDPDRPSYQEILKKLKDEK
ncbi:thiamine pyrophosphate-dependent enzyme [Desulfospira joergensenii]|uniref:thiamine pyrophosphate-dependent enzyme n=1 Tax=Desulfospira joergensenii TaxID=53329 RepID=UPI0003B5D013|nr:thiamine pyrophosphate-dependent enzyme [Desulfospira joergensenii]